MCLQVATDICASFRKERKREIICLPIITGPWKSPVSLCEFQPRGIYVERVIGKSISIGNHRSIHMHNSIHESLAIVAAKPYQYHHRRAEPRSATKWRRALAGASWAPSPPLYYASIVSVSGLGDDDWGPQPVQFNFTLGVQSRSPMWRRACIERGTAVEVAYHGVELMYGTTDWELCAVPRQIWTLRYVMASMGRSNMSGLPEFVVGGLVADARRGVQVLDLTFRIPSTRHDRDDGRLVRCMGRLVGDNNVRPDQCMRRALLLVINGFLCLPHTPI